MDATRIEEVVGDFVTLKKEAWTTWAYVLFTTKKRLLSVNPTRGIYKCFVCGAAGNAVNFLMEHEHVSYPDAIRNLAARYNIEIEETLTTQRLNKHNNSPSATDFINCMLLLKVILRNITKPMR